MASIPVNPVTDPKAYPTNVNQKHSEQDPEHYSNLPIEPWDFIQKNKLDFFEGNVVKYVCRWRNKGGIDDLRKAITYIEKIIEGENSK